MSPSGRPAPSGRYSHPGCGPGRRRRQPDMVPRHGGRRRPAPPPPAPRRRRTGEGIQTPTRSTSPDSTAQTDSVYVLPRDSDSDRSKEDRRRLLDIPERHRPLRQELQKLSLRGTSRQSHGRGGTGYVCVLFYLLRGPGYFRRLFKFRDTFSSHPPLDRKLSLSAQA